MAPRLARTTLDTDTSAQFSTARCGTQQTREEVLPCRQLVYEAQPVGTWHKSATPRNVIETKSLVMLPYRNDVQQTGPDATAKVRIAVRSTAPLGNKSLSQAISTSPPPLSEVN